MTVSNAGAVYVYWFAEYAALIGSLSSAGPAGGGWRGPAGPAGSVGSVIFDVDLAHIRVYLTLIARGGQHHGHLVLFRVLDGDAGSMRGVTEGLIEGGGRLVSP